jgi:hypothetical protein
MGSKLEIVALAIAAAPFMLLDEKNRYFIFYYRKGKISVLNIISLKIYLVNKNYMV